MNQSFSREVKAGMDMGPWLIAGPVYRDMAGELDERTFFENPQYGVGQEETENAVEEFAAAIHHAAPCENDSAEWSGDDSRQIQWTYLRSPERYFGFGRYFVTNHLGVIVAHCRVYTDHAQSVKVRISTRLTNRLRLFVNGEVAADNPALAGLRLSKPQAVECRISLKAGENRFTLLVLRIARNAEIGWRMQLLEAETPLRVQCPIQERADCVREEIEYSASRTHMETDTCTKEDEIAVQVGEFTNSQITVLLRLDKEGGQTVAQASCIQGGRIVLARALSPGEYQVHAVWSVQETEIVTLQFPLTVYKTLEPNPGYEQFEERRRIFLEACAQEKPETSAEECANIALARYQLGQYDAVTYEMVDQACCCVDRRDDCADFVLLPLLRLVHRERQEAKLPREFTERIRRSAIGFKYWVDEANDCLMWFDSENHRLGFHTLEYLAGLLFPQDIFTNSGQNGLFHCMKGRMHLMEWMSQRIRFGFNEFHSDSYLPVTMGPLLALREMAPYEEFSLWKMAEELIHILVFNLAVNNYNGTIASPRGRSYNLLMRNPLRQGTTSILYLLFGRDRAALRMTPGAMALAIGSYIPPRPIYETAYCYEETQFRYKSGLYHEGKQNADITALRTPEYMVASVREHNVGKCDGHLHVAQITMPNDIILFFSAPLTIGEGSGLRPDYWAGQAFAPQVWQYRGTLAVRWKDVSEPFIWMTHCHFDVRKFDEVRQEEGWTLGRVKDSYVGVWSDQPHEIAGTGFYANRELRSEGPENCWIAECGSAREDGSFDEFCKRLCAAPITVTNDRVEFVSPKNGRICFAREFTVEGREVPAGEMTVDCPYMSSRYGSGIYHFHFRDWEETIWSYASRV